MRSGDSLSQLTLVAWERSLHTEEQSKLSDRRTIYKGLEGPRPSCVSSFCRGKTGVICCLGAVCSWPRCHGLNLLDPGSLCWKKCGITSWIRAAKKKTRKPAWAPSLRTGRLLSQHMSHSYMSGEASSPWCFHTRNEVTYRSGKFMWSFQDYSKLAATSSFIINLAL